MHKNVTLSIEEQILLKAKHMAVENKKSLSQWLTDLIGTSVHRETDTEKAKKTALHYLKKGSKSVDRLLEKNFMNANQCFVDTNILIYAYDQSNKTKQYIAQKHIPTSTLFSITH